MYTLRDYALSQCYVFFLVPVYHLGCAIDAVSGVAALSAQQPAEHVKKALQNITTDRMPQSVEGFLITSETVIFHNTIEE